MGELPNFGQQLLDELRPRVQPVIAAREAEQAKMRAYEDTCRAYDIPILNTMNTLSRLGLLSAFDTPHAITLAEDDTMRLSLNVSSSELDDEETISRTINISLGVDHPKIVNSLAAIWTHGASYSLPIDYISSEIYNLARDGAYGKDDFGNILNPTDINIRRQGKPITRLHHLAQTGYEGNNPTNIFSDLPETPEVLSYGNNALLTIAALARLAAHDLHPNGNIRRPNSKTLEAAIKFATAGAPTIQK